VKRAVLVLALAACGPPHVAPAPDVSAIPRARLWDDFLSSGSATSPTIAAAMATAANARLTTM